VWFFVHSHIFILYVMLTGTCPFKAVGTGSGLYGSVTTADLGKAPVASPASLTATPAAAIPGATYTDLPVSNIRAVIAKRLQLSKQVFFLNYGIP
jgi:pyruvate dehydrogenase E2 component (dihydrolipoamide acetyltransferase)